MISFRLCRFLKNTGLRGLFFLVIFSPILIVARQYFLLELIISLFLDVQLSHVGFLVANYIFGCTLFFVQGFTQIGYFLPYIENILINLTLQKQIV